MSPVIAPVEPTGMSAGIKSQHVATQKKIDDRTAVRTGDGCVYVPIVSLDFRMLFHNSVHRRCGFSGNANRDQTIMTRSL